jgi:hypothetical protein
MNRRTIHIDAIRVRAKGVPARQARRIADGLSEAIAQALAVRGITRPGPSGVSIPEMNLGRIAVDGRPSAGIGAEIAARIADSVAGRLEPKG